MIDTNELKSLRDATESNVLLAVKCAKNGHNHIVQSHSISSIKLLEITSELLNFREKFGEFEGIKK